MTSHSSSLRQFLIVLGVSLACGGVLILLLALESEIPDHDGLSEPLAKSGRLAQSNSVAKSSIPPSQPVKAPPPAPANAQRGTEAAPPAPPAEAPRPPQPEPASAPANPAIPAPPPPAPAQPPAAAETPDPLSLKPAARRELDRALAPLLNYTVSAGDMAQLKEAVRLTDDDEFDEARGAAGKIADPTARKLALWYLMRSNGAGTPYAEIIRFRQENPLWPSRDTLDAAIEAGLILQDASPETVLAYFRGRTPATGAGKAALAGALIATGDIARGKALIGETWRRSVLDRGVEARTGQRFAAYLTEADHRARLNWLKAKDPKKFAASIDALREKVGAPAEAAQESRLTKAKRVLAARLASAKEKAKNAALAVKTRITGKRAHIPLAKEAAQDSGTMLARVKELRRRDAMKHAWSLLRSVPRTAAGPLEAPDWWEERRQHVRAALNAGYPKTAYAIARYHGPLTGEALSDSEFLAGWIALRFLSQPAAARAHFTASAAAGGLPRDRARASYWLGRAELASGRKGPAETAFKEAAQYNHVFYGQLAKAAQGGASRETFRAPHIPGENEIRNFVQQDAARALVIAKAAGIDSLVPVFLFELARGIESPADMTLTAELALRLAPLQITVRFAKVAMNRGFATEYYAFPGSAERVKQLTGNSPLEPAFILALTRQESEFNPNIVSSAGARGLMQLMPATAKQMARDANVKFDAKRIAEPELNMKLGAHFLGKLTGNYGGSYIMTLAAYNAGPGRLREWTGKFGDPRAAGTDPIDWIERIPFAETHDYVHKIMESVQLYRAKLGTGDPKLRLHHDLNRGRTQQVTQSGGN